MNGHYYIYKGYKWKYPCTDYESFNKANGLIVKYYTDEQFEELYGNNCPHYVWEKVEETKSIDNQ